MRSKKILTVISIILAIFLISANLYAQGSGDASLTRGWDIFGDPLSSGSVKWQVTDRGVIVQFELRGARPTHAYTVGVHLFNPYNKTSKIENNIFGGYPVGGEGVITREGNTAYTIAWDFGQLYTNGNGDGFARFDLSVPPGTYYCQFTVRIGGEGTCLTTKGITHGCAAVYRTGNRFAQNFEIITIGSSMGGDTGRSYTSQPYGQTPQPYGRQYTSQPYGRQYTSPPVSMQLPPEQPIQQVQPPPPPPPRQDEDEFTRTYRRVDEYLRK